MWNWRRWFLAWDGLLPLAVSAVPYLIRAIFPKNDIAQVSTVIFVPIAAALLRTVIGSYQVQSVCDGDLPANRQFALGVAIMFLLLYEGTVSILIFADDEPLSAWAYPLVFYLCYLATVAFAFSRPARHCNDPRARNPRE